MAEKILEKKQRICSFCGRSESQVKSMTSSDLTNSVICNECVAVSKCLMADSLEKRKAELFSYSSTPQELKRLLDQHVIGQDWAKTVLAVAIYNHYLRSTISPARNGIKIDKSNILLIGPTGSGKTLLAKTIAEALNLPFFIADATRLTAAGYYGDDVESIVDGLYRAAKNDVFRTEMGIIYIDEIDKIAGRGQLADHDVSGKSVQQGLLKIVEGEDVALYEKNSHNSPIKCVIDTTNILFFAGGAFSELQEFTGENNGRTIGFIDQENNSRSSEITPDDLMKYGMLPEFVSRFPIICELNKLTENDMVEILISPEDALVKQYQHLFKAQNVNLSFEISALKEIARQAYNLQTGARGLRSILEKFMTDIMFLIPSERDIAECRITEGVIKGVGEPKIIRREKRLIGK